MPQTTAIEMAIQEASKMIEEETNILNSDMYGNNIKECQKNKIFVLKELIERLEKLKLEIDEYRCEKCGAEGCKFLCRNCDVKMDDGWIPVSEILPEEGRDVLVYGEGMCVDCYETPSRITYLNGFSRDSHAKYWRSLPLPPTKPMNLPEPFEI